MDRSADPTLFALLAIMGYHNRSAVGYSGLELGFDGLEGGVGSAERSTTVQESWIDGVIHCNLRKLDRRSDPLQRVFALIILLRMENGLERCFVFSCILGDYNGTLKHWQASGTLGKRKSGSPQVPCKARSRRKAGATASSFSIGGSSILVTARLPHLRLPRRRK